jgi:hypothetical protein
MANDDTDRFDYSPLGQAWWVQAGRELGASDKQTKFAASKHRGTSNTRAAEEAGYTASTDVGLRTTAHRVFKSNMVQNLLAMTAAEGGGPDGGVDRKEARRILSSLARGSDPSIRIRACEALAKLDAEDTANRNASEPEFNPEEAAREILRSDPRYGLAYLANMTFTARGVLWAMPFLTELAPLLKRDFPDEWARYVAAMPSAHHRQDLERLGNGPLLTVQEAMARSPAAVLKLKNLSFIETKPVGNGHDATTPTQKE